LSSVLDNRPFECDATRGHATRRAIEWSAREAGRIYGNKMCFSSEAAFRHVRRPDSVDGLSIAFPSIHLHRSGGKARSAAEHVQDLLQIALVALP
jgi:hypothetical protein